MQAFLAIASRSFQQMISYRFEAWIGMLIGLSMTATFVALWTAVSRNDPAQLATVLAYVLSTRMLSEMQSPDVIHQLQTAIRTGSVAVELLKPISYPLRLAAEQAGRSAWLVLRTAPVYLALSWLLGVQWPDAGRLALFALSGLLGLIIALLLQMAVGSIVFFVLDVEGVHNMLDFAEAIFAGSLIPLWLLPTWFTSIARALPFQATLYIPGAIFSGRLTGAALYGSLLEQLAWILALAVGVAALWRLATRKLVVQGG